VRRLRQDGRVKPKVRDVLLLNEPFSEPVHLAITRSQDGKDELNGMSVNMGCVGIT
jgi:hypothetical protein